MYLLDTVAISETSKPDAHAGMQAFYSRVQVESLYISAVSIGELNYGWMSLPYGKRRENLRDWFSQVEAAFDGRVMSVDSDIARIWGELRTSVKKNGYTIGLPDLLIAATAIHYDLTVVTRNIKDFAPTGCKVLNPWDVED